MAKGPRRTLEEQINRFRTCCQIKNLQFISCIPSCILIENRSQPFISVQCGTCHSNFSTSFQQLIHRQPTCPICRPSKNDDVKNAVIPRDSNFNPIIKLPDLKTFPQTGFLPLKNIRTS